MPRVIYFEIHADVPERAMEFYAKLFGWKFNPFPGNIPYWMISTGTGEAEKGIDGGLSPRRGATPVAGQPVNAFVCTVQVSSVDEYVGKATAGGGVNVVPKMPIPGVGWLAYCTDTEGNIFGMMQEDATAH